MRKYKKNYLYLLTNRRYMDKDKIIKLFLSGKTVREICTEFHCDYNTIYKIVKPIKPPRFTYKDFSSDDREAIRDLYNSKHSTVYIGKKYGVSHHTIANLLEDMGIPRDGKSRRKFELNEEYFHTESSIYLRFFVCRWL